MQHFLKERKGSISDADGINFQEEELLICIWQFKIIFCFSKNNNNSFSIITTMELINRQINQYMSLMTIVSKMATVNCF